LLPPSPFKRFEILFWSVPYKFPPYPPPADEHVLVPPVPLTVRKNVVAAGAVTCWEPNGDTGPGNGLMIALDAPLDVVHESMYVVLDAVVLATVA